MNKTEKQPETPQVLEHSVSKRFVFNWELIGKDDYKCSVDGYLLRVEKMSNKHWWWCVYFGNDEVENKYNNFANKGKKAKALAEILCLEHFTNVC
jgi:hypothetical protein